MSSQSVEVIQDKMFEASRFSVAQHALKVRTRREARAADAVIDVDGRIVQRPSLLVDE
ncbi:MAG: hypothetical protein ABL986_04240 [Vicinamibacterales bacterium]